LGAWVGLEINLLSFIPLITHNNQFSAEAALKYFLVQALASALLLFAVILIYSAQSYLISNFQFYPPHLLIRSALFLKIGAAPFHFWFPGVIEGLRWPCNILLITWQKIAPLILTSYIISINYFSIFIIISSAIAGSLGGFNQTSLRKIIAYSSINHLGWITAALIVRDSVWLLYFRFYSFLSLTSVILFNQFQLSHLNQIYSLPLSNPFIKILIFGNLFSLRGLPPFTGFFPKWIVIQTLVALNHLFLISFIVIITLITLFFYLRITYSAILLTHSEPKWVISQTDINAFLLFLVSLSLLGLPLSCLVILIY